MATLFLDGFDLYSASQVANFWNIAQNIDGISSSYARYGQGQGMKINTNATRTIPNTGTLIFGFAIYFQAGYFLSKMHWYLSDAGTSQVCMYLDANGRMFFKRGWENGPQIGDTSTFTLTSDTWYYLEFKVVIHSSAGSVECRCNGTTILTVTGVNTQVTTNSYVNQVSLGGNGSTHVMIDDMYCLDNSGSLNNNYLGDLIVRGQVVDGAGSSTQWTANGAATNWQCVSQAQPDDDTTYVSSNTPGQVDLYTVTDLPATATTVFAVQPIVRLKKDDAGVRTARSLLKSGSTTNESSDIAPGGSYFSYPRVLDADPDTSAAWTVAAANALEVGVKEQA